LQFLKLRKKIVSGDILFIQKELPSFIILLLLKLCNDRIVYDFDDAVYIRHDPENFTYKKSSKLKRRFDRICQNVSLVIAGNEILQKQAVASGACKTVAIPTSVEIKENPNKSKKNNKVNLIKLGWVGQKVNLPYLERMEPIFLTLLKRGYKFKLQVLSNQRPRFSLFNNFEYLEWSIKKESLFLKNIDIGLMPLLKNKYTEGKCAYKALQYMSYSKPAIVSDVGINKKWLSGACLFYKTNDEAILAFEKLIRNEKLRRMLGKRGNIIIKENFEASKIANKIKVSINEILQA
jgi:glycosyltransferase involved in cell wall biosynthesis